MNQRSPIDGSATARPVADAPVDALIERAEDLARRWAIALIATRPLAEMAEAPLEDLAREAPALCAQLARALRSDDELEQMLAPSAAGGRGGAMPARRFGVLAGARNASSAVYDVDALRGVIWEVALGELRDATARQVADLSDRLAFVCAALLAAVLERRELAGALDTPRAPAASGHERVLYSSPQTSPGGRRAVLIDERDEAAARPARGGEAPVAGRGAAPSDEAARSSREVAPDRPEPGRPDPAAPRPRPWDTPLDAARQAPGPGLEDRAPRRAAPEGEDAELRLTRGPGLPVDERSR